MRALADRFVVLARGIDRGERVAGPEWIAARGIDEHERDLTLSVLVDAAITVIPGSAGGERVRTPDRARFGRRIEVGLPNHVLRARVVHDMEIHRLPRPGL